MFRVVPRRDRSPVLRNHPTTSSSTSSTNLSVGSRSRPPRQLRLTFGSGTAAGPHHHHSCCRHFLRHFSSSTVTSTLRTSDSVTHPAVMRSRIDICEVSPWLDPELSLSPGIVEKWSSSLVSVQFFSKRSSRRDRFLLMRARARYHDWRAGYA